MKMAKIGLFTNASTLLEENNLNYIMPNNRDTNKLNLSDLARFYANLEEGIDFAKILEDTGVRYLLLIEKGNQSYTYSNELPLDSLAKIVSELFYTDTRFKEMVLKRTDAVKQLSEWPDKDSPNEFVIKMDSDEKPDQNEGKDPEEQLPPEYLQEKYNISTKTLANWRSEKRGPKYIKMGKKIRYLRKDVEKWFSENTVKTYNKPKKM